VINVEMWKYENDAQFDLFISTLPHFHISTLLHKPGDTDPQRVSTH